MSPAVVSNVSLSLSRRLQLLLTKLFRRFSWPVFLSLLALASIGILAIYLADHRSPQPFPSSQPWKLIL
ncbi:MAG: hypothetical protein KAT11_04190, partial [Phycisphaerae bacterium]|nr:hypothetical protein [Phycisphaerae bacterium]